jgi:hypothetical protein
MRLTPNKNLKELPMAQVAQRSNMTLEELIRAQPRVIAQVQSTVRNTSVDNSDSIGWIWILLIPLAIPTVIVVVFLLYWILKIIIVLFCIAVLIAVASSVFEG